MHEDVLYRVLIYLSILYIYLYLSPLLVRRREKREEEEECGRTKVERKRIKQEWQMEVAKVGSRYVVDEKGRRVEPKILKEEKEEAGEMEDGRRISPKILGRGIFCCFCAAFIDLFCPKY